MAKELPQGKSNKKVIDRHVSFKSIGRKPLADGERKTTIGVGLKQSELDALEAQCEAESHSSGVTITISELGRKAILKYLQEVNAVKVKA